MGLRLSQPQAGAWAWAWAELGKMEKQIMTFIVATNVVASRPPERQPTGTPHARANCFNNIVL